jgi:hypothetical protein
MIRPTRGLACIVPLIAALCAVACDDDARDPGMVMRDSAGIRIVDNASPQWAEGEAWAVGVVRPDATLEKTDAEAAWADTAHV